MPEDVDYPDWERGIRLVGSDITLQINIETSSITLPINIIASEITLDVNIAAQAANIAFEFADQSVAVFDAAKWFAHQAQHVYVYGAATIVDDYFGVVCSYAVPAGKNFFIAGMSYGATLGSYTPTAMSCWIQTDTNKHVNLGSYRGHGIVFDTPLRFPAGTVIYLYGEQCNSGGSISMKGTMWGYVEAA